MATITASEVSQENEWRHILWETLTVANGDGSAIEVQGYSRATVIMTGTWDTNTMVLQGSNDGSTWATLKDEGGNAISATADASFTFTVSCRQVRPLNASGTTVDVDVSILLNG